MQLQFSTTSEGSESTLLVDFFYTARLCHKLTAETKSPVKQKHRETQPSFEPDNEIT